MYQEDNYHLQTINELIWNFGFKIHNKFQQITSKNLFNITKDFNNWNLKSPIIKNHIYQNFNIHQ